MKVYSKFTDKFSNEYSFSNYADFARFWFDMHTKTAKYLFPEFAKLQKAAYNSKEARTKI